MRESGKRDLEHTNVYSADITDWRCRPLFIRSATLAAVKSKPPTPRPPYPVSPLSI